MESHGVVKPSLWYRAFADQIREIAEACDSAPLTRLWVEQWQVKIPAMLAAVPDDYLVHAWQMSEGMTGDPLAEALASELKRRVLDF